MQKYGKKFDIEQAQADYKYANTPQTQATLKYLNSLTGVNNTGGNLQALIDASDKINRTRFPALNDVAAWTRLETGDPGITALKATAVETADQAAKILQGGGTGSGTSDAKLKQAVELFNTGFSKDQIKSSAGALRGLLGNRKKEMIGDNRYLLKQYSGGWSPANQGGGGASPAPEGTIVTVNGKQMIKQGGQWVAH